METHKEKPDDFGKLLPQDIKNAYAGILPPELLEQAVRIGNLSGEYTKYVVRYYLEHKTLLSIVERGRWLAAQSAPENVKISVGMQVEPALSYLGKLLLKNNFSLTEEECDEIIIMNIRAENEGLQRMMQHVRDFKRGGSNG